MGGHGRYEPRRYAPKLPVDLTQNVRPTKICFFLCFANRFREPWRSTFVMPRRFVIIVLSFVLLGAAVAFVLFVRRSFVHKASTVQPMPQASSAAPAVTAAPVATQWPTPFSVELRALPVKEALPPGTLRILVLGDSVAKFLGLAMRYRQDEKQAFVAERGVGSCSIFEAKPYVENGKTLMSSSCSASWAADVAELRPDVTLILMGGGYLSDGACTKSFQTAYEKRVFDLVKVMEPHAGQIVITRVPYPVKTWRHSNVLERADCFNEMLVRIAQKGHYDVVDLMHYVCPSRACNMESNGKPLRPDGLHFDGGGTEDTARWVLDELRRKHRGRK